MSNSRTSTNNSPNRGSLMKNKKKIQEFLSETTGNWEQNWNKAGKLFHTNYRISTEQNDKNIRNNTLATTTDHWNKGHHPRREGKGAKRTGRQKSREQNLITYRSVEITCMDKEKEKNMTRRPTSMNCVKTFLPSEKWSWNKSFDWAKRAHDLDTKNYTPKCNGRGKEIILQNTYKSQNASEKFDISISHDYAKEQRNKIRTQVIAAKDRIPKWSIFVLPSDRPPTAIASQKIPMKIIQNPRDEEKGKQM